MARGFAGQGRGARLRKSWSAMTVADVVVMSTTQAVIGSVSLGAGSGLEATVLRSRGELLVTASPDDVADSDILGLGLIVVRAAALAAGGVSVPGPILDQSSDSWLWHQYVPLDAFGASTEATARTGGSAWSRVVVDAKAMRRLPEDSAVVLVGELTSGDFASVIVSGGVRFLLGT